MLSLKPSNLKRYKDIGWLFVKYGYSDLLRQTSLATALQDDDSDVEFSAELDAKPEEFAADLERLGPTFVKLGQVLASRGDLLPESYTQALSRLQDDVAQVPFERVEQVIFEELGKRVDLAFREFDPTPIAAASLGQVHRAKLHNGTPVAVKIQRPGIRHQIAEDIEAMMEIAKELEAHSATARRYRVCSIVETLAVQLRQELNYTNEDQNAARLRTSMQDFDRIRIPAIYSGLSTDRVLTMEFVAGDKVTELNAKQLRLLDGPKLASELFRCYLHQLLVDGCFHADPHPGNLLVTQESDICLLDFGLTVNMDRQMRTHLIKVLMGLSDGDGEQVAQEILEASGQMGQSDPSAFRDGIVRIVGQHRGASLETLHVGRILLEIQMVAIDTGVCLREEVRMLGKTLMQLDEVVLMLDPEFQPEQMLKQYLPDIVGQTHNQPTTMAQLYQMFTESSELTQALPQRLNHITRMLANNEMRIKVDTIDETAFLSGMHKIANRITTGLILAALIVGASLIMKVDTPFTIFGYPAIAMFFFVTAAVCGLRLVYKAAFRDAREIE